MLRSDTPKPRPLQAARVAAPAIPGTRRDVNEEQSHVQKELLRQEPGVQRKDVPENGVQRAEEHGRDSRDVTFTSRTSPQAHRLSPVGVLPH